MDVVAKRSNETVTAAVSGSYALGTENVAGAGHIAVMQAQGFDAKALSSLGGPSSTFAHAATLNSYRVRAADCKRLVARGETKRAKTVAEDIFADFEASNAHEALEDGDGKAYEGFESGLEALTSAAESGNEKAVETAITKVDTNLRAGIETLGTGVQPAILQAGFFRARFADALERYERGESKAAATIAQSLFARFEKNELDMHETLEGTSDSLYDRFEHEHLEEGLIPALKGDGSGATTHFEGSMKALLDFETKAASASVVAGAEASFHVRTDFRRRSRGDTRRHETGERHRGSDVRTLRTRRRWLPRGAGTRGRRALRIVRDGAGERHGRRGYVREGVDVRPRGGQIRLRRREKHGRRLRRRGGHGRTGLVLPVRESPTFTRCSNPKTATPTRRLRRS